MANRRSKAILVLLGSIGIAIAVSFWGLTYNTGELIIESSVTPFVINGMYDQPETCELAVCVFVVKPKIYNLEFSSENYTNETAEAFLKRGQTLRLSYEPEKIPEITEYQNSSLTIKNLLYLEDGENGSTDIFLRDGNETDQKITNFAGDQPIKLISDKGSRYALAITEAGDYVEIDLEAKRKKIVKIPKTMTETRLIGEKWLIWQENNQFYIGEYDYPPKDKNKLRIESIDHIVGLDKKTAILISKANLDPENQKTASGNNLISLLGKSNEADELATELGKEGQYRIYKLNLDTGETSYIMDLPEEINSTQFELRKEYQTDLTPLILLETPKDIWRLGINR
jgi:hypothetical protein